MLVLINGPHRTGSTLAYEIAKQVLSIDTDCIRLEYSQRTQQKNDSWNYLIKEHYALPKDVPEVRCITTFRNIYDVVYSAYRMFRPEDNFTGWADGLVDQYIRFVHEYTVYSQKFNCLTVPYEGFYGKEPLLVQYIADYLGVPVDQSDIDHIAKRVSAQNVNARAGSDADFSRVVYSEYRQGHVGADLGAPGAGRKQLPGELKQSIKSRLQEWYKFTPRLG